MTNNKLRAASPMLRPANRQVKVLSNAPEEELMDLPLHAEAYAQADFSEPNSMFVALFSEQFPAFNGERILDLGCGPPTSQ